MGLHDLFLEAPLLNIIYIVFCCRDIGDACVGRRAMGACDG